MITINPYEELGHAQHGWLEARHHFSFAEYHNPKRMEFGALRVINDDVIKAGTGFDTHPHRDMEIITYVRKGAITHRDSHGNKGRTEAGDVQVMSAGRGVFHSEYNLEDVDTNIYQIWIQPNKRGVDPDWNSHAFPKDPVKNKLSLLVSGNGEAPLSIHQDAYIYAGRLEKATIIDHPIIHQIYLLVSEGCLEINGREIRKGDGVQITDRQSFKIKALSDAEVLAIDVPNSYSK
ncbi:MAG: pirin family protein [Sneathiella sp.]|uniref:pirin family protein n=1 Tax=Sneathiella sp. TaxID=1964365 RepID=UPI0030013E5B